MKPRMMTETLLHLAAEKGSKEKLDFLLERNAKLYNRNKKNEKLYVKNKKGNTVLHTAAIRGVLELVEFLIEKGADANSVNKARRTAFQEAKKANKSKVAKFLKPKTLQKFDGEKIEI